MASTLPYSDAIFICLFPRECTEAFLEGHRRAFEFFGGVPSRISYDILKIAVAQRTGPHERELTLAFLRLISHYLFKPHFCRVRRANEKGPPDERYCGNRDVTRRTHVNGMPNLQY